ncbi:MAG: nitrilase-related carbon-nitrogen hydrolase [Armatimonadota bacterium]
MNIAPIDIVMVQTDPIWHAPEANHRAVEDLLARVDLRSGSLVVLPETFATGFTNDPAFAEAPGGASDAFLANLARTRHVWVVAGLLRRGAYGAVRNCAVAVDPSGTERAVYAKRRPFRPGGEPWTAGHHPVVLGMGDFRVALHICFDLRFPELFRDTLEPDSPDLHVVIASWPVARIAQWELLLRARAVENQAWLVGVNRTGEDPFHSHVGASLVVDPTGTIRAHAGSAPGVVATQCDIGSARELRRQLPFLPGAVA